MSLVARGCVLGPLREVVSGLGQVCSAAHERERTEADGGGLRRPGHGRCTVAADEANQSLDPRSDAGSRAAQPIPETPARPQQKRANGRRAERELVRELAVGEPADLAQEEALALGGRQPLDLVPHGRELAGAQELRGGVRACPSGRSPVGTGATVRWRKRA
jgi:hypothetical protein